MQDELTRLPGRREFSRGLAEKIRESRESGFTLALLIVKILHLHDINAAFGYRAGDQLLSDAGARIKSMLREDDELYRIGGNTFALVLPALKNENIARLAVNKLLTLLQEPFLIDGKPIKAHIKIGVAFSPLHTYVPERLSQFADTALEYAIRGTESFQIYEQSQSVSESHTMALEQELHSALENDELMMYYQPQFDLPERTICGMEALIRWRSPVHGFVSPELFIPLAEKGGLILPLTLWTFNAAMRQHNWLADNRVDAAVSINLSATMLNLPELVEHVTSAMNIWGISPEKLTLELTESAFMENPEKSLATLRQLHEQGISLSIDDFGTGYSSMSYLSRLPVSELKIDKSFVSRMTTNDNDFKLVRSIIELAHNFDLKVVAEGIEDVDTMSSLIELGCDRGQGYFLGRPMPVEDFLAAVQAIGEQGRECPS